MSSEPQPTQGPVQKPTQKQVAQRAGVSQTIVSQVLNGREVLGRISPETRRRVQQAIQDLGYVPNAAARRLVGSQSSLVGVFTYEAVFPSNTRNFYAPFLEGIEHQASRSGLDLLLYTGGAGQGLSAALRGRLSLTDGTVLLGNPDGTDRRELAALVASGHPVVFVGRRELSGTDLFCVQADYTSATAALTQRLRQLGHAQVWYLGQPERHESALDREQGFRAAMPGGQVVRLRPDQLAPALLHGAVQQGVRAFLLENDALMRRFLQISAAANLRLPEDVSAAVLGDAISSEPADPAWSGFCVPRFEMGQGAVQLLAHRLYGTPEPQRVFGCLPWTGTTVGPCP